MYINVNQQVCTHHFHLEKNVILACNNSTISPHVAEHFNCNRETQWMTVAKHKSEVLQMDMVVLLNSFCSINTQEQVWELYYFCPPAMSVSYARTLMLL